MRRLLLLPLVLLGFASGVAVGANVNSAAGTGMIKSLSSTSIAVHSVYDVSCKVASSSPKLGDYRVGMRVKIGCKNGILARIEKINRLASAPSGSTPEKATEKAATTASGKGEIVALNGTYLTVRGDHPLTCTLNWSSPGLGEYRVGDRVKVGCLNGFLYVISKTSTEPPVTTPGTTPEKPGTTASGAGAITALSAGSITVSGERVITCTVSPSSPGLGDYELGDKVKIACQNGVLRYVVGIDTQPATTSTGTTNAYGIGTLSALSSSSITVTGDRALSCTIASTSPRLGDYHLGDRVKIACQSGTLSGIAKTDIEPTSTPAANPEKSTSASGIGAITALSATSITVYGDRALTCTVNSSSPGVGDYQVGDKVKIGCLNGSLSYIAKTDTPPSTPAPTTNAYGIGTLSALGSSSITVTGENTLTCTIAPTSPRLGDYHLGDRVKIACQSGTLSGITRA